MEMLLRVVRGEERNRAERVGGAGDRTRRHCGGQNSCVVAAPTELVSHIESVALIDT